MYYAYIAISNEENTQMTNGPIEHIYCVDSHDNENHCCRFYTSSVKTLAEHIAHEHHRYYGKASATKRARELREMQINGAREDVMHALGFARCISAWSDGGHYVTPEQMANKYDCVDCVAKRQAEAA
jgi:hypothetical protein